jgi:osmoprotectant transport system substrate-binding protein
MFTATKKGRVVLSALAVGAVVALAGCSSSDPLDEGSGATAGGDTIVIGSQDYYSNEIIAEIYAQALEGDGYEVDRQFRIGQREVYIQEIEDGRLDLFPEYTGPLLQYWEPGSTVTDTTEVYDALVGAAPGGLRVLDQSAATDQDVYVVTRQFAEKHDVTTVADLSKISEKLILGGASEGEDRPNGPKGLKQAYGLDVDFTPVEDGGGPLTVKALQDGTVDVAVMYSADPAVSGNDLVQLGDPESLLLASHVVPIASDRLDGRAEDIIDQIGGILTPEGIIALNTASIEDQESASVIAKQWLSTHDVE